MSEPSTLLIVEDEEPLLEVLKERFENEGFQVIFAQNGEEALQMALTQHPDIILLDIVMPKMSGLQMLKELRAHEEGKTVPVMILTNLNDAESIKEGLGQGAYDILVKADWQIGDIVQNVKDKLSFKQTEN
jgi:DNA-binding response OmpR family regulator